MSDGAIAGLVFALLTFVILVGGAVAAFILWWRARSNDSIVSKVERDDRAETMDIDAELAKPLTSQANEKDDNDEEKDAAADADDGFFGTNPRDRQDGFFGTDDASDSSSR